MADNNRRWSDEAVLTRLKGKSPLNKARAVFSSEMAKLEQAAQQRVPLSPVELGRMEFEAVLKIMSTYRDAVMGVDQGDD